MKHQLTYRDLNPYYKFNRLTYKQAILVVILAILILSL